jgi:class 3 adenylate cyclase
MSIDEKFRELATTAAPSRAIAHLRTLVEGEDELAVYKLNAFRFADDAGVSRAEAVRTLLFATRIGLFDLNYDIFCPSCGGIPDYPRALMGVRSHSHCALCRVDIDVDFEEHVEVTFTANPEVRAISFKDFADRTELHDRLAWIRTIKQREQREHLLGALIAPGETQTLRVKFDAGTYKCRLPAHLEKGCDLHVSGEPTDAVQTLAFTVREDGDVTPKHATLRPGACDVTIAFGYRELWGFAIEPVRPRHNFVSAAYLTAQQDFRDLFSGEFLAPDVNFAIKSTTLMFTDIKGSTEMYEALGDARAYRRVRDHFDLMTEVIRTHEGGIVKTIGDAVMASFPVNANAVKAACAIQRAFHEVAEPLKGVEVKIGMHRGPAIAVTTNRNLDFFGRTVNIAARVQGKSSPRHVLVSAPVLEDPAVRAYLTEHGLEPREMKAELKGIAGAHTLFAIEPVRGAAK